MLPMGAWMIGHWSFNLSVRALDGHMLRLSPAKGPAAGNRTLALEERRGQAACPEGRPGTNGRACTAVTCIESRYRKCAPIGSMLTHASTVPCSR